MKILGTPFLFVKEKMKYCAKKEKGVQGMMDVSMKNIVCIVFVVKRSIFKYRLFKFL